MMKVIAKTKDGYILEASTDDIAAIQGLYSHETKIEIGTVLDFYGLFKNYRYIDHIFKDSDSFKKSIDLANEAVEWIKQFRGKEE